MARNISDELDKIQHTYVSSAKRTEIMTWASLTLYLAVSAWFVSSQKAKERYENDKNINSIESVVDTTNYNLPNFLDFNYSPKPDTNIYPLVD